MHQLLHISYHFKFEMLWKKNCQTTNHTYDIYLPYTSIVVTGTKKNDKHTKCHNIFQILSLALFLMIKTAEQMPYHNRIIVINAFLDDKTC